MTEFEREVIKAYSYNFDIETIAEITETDPDEIRKIIAKNIDLIDKEEVKKDGND